MIVAMYNDTRRNYSILVIIIERDNLDRMREADPITLESQDKGGVMPVPRYPRDFSMLIAYEEDQPKIMDYARRHDLAGMIEYLERGRKFIEGLDGAEHSKRIPHPKEN
jgi:hypothetical protein